MVLVAGATSLPEVVTDVSASLADAPDLAVGDLFGSSMANMAILAVLDLHERRRVWPQVEVGHAAPYSSSPNGRRDVTACGGRNRRSAATR